MSTPEVRVRLSPEGVKEVIAALRDVQNEGRKANTGAARGIAGLKSELLSLKRLLPTIGLATAVTGAVLLGKRALQTADEVGKLGQQIGATTEHVSVFVREAELGNATIDDTRAGLGALATNLLKLQQGQQKAAQGFAELGLSAKDFVGLDTVEASEKVAVALAKESDATKRAALAKQLLGDAGQKLLPTLLELADKGLAGATAEAAKLGLVIDDKLAGAAQAANDSFTVISQQVRGLAIQFVSGLAPAVVQAMTSFSDATAGTGVESIQKWGQITGRVVGLVINLLNLLGGIVGGVFELLGNAIGASFAQIKAILSGNFSEALAISKAYYEDQAKLINDTFVGAVADTKKLINDLNKDPPVIVPKVRAQPTGDATQAIAENDQVQKARLDALKKSIDAELALLNERNKAETDANQRAYDRGLISLTQFIDRRRQLIEEQARAEIEALRKQQAAIAANIDNVSVGPKADADRLKAKADIGELDQKIRLQELQLAREIASVEADRFDGARKLADEQRQAANTLDELEGNRHAVFQRNLEDEIRQLRELGGQAGQSAEQIDATVSRLTAARQSRFNFDEVTRQGKTALDSFNRDAELIRRDAEAGVTSQLEGERRLIELQSQRLGVLQQLATAGLEAAKATGDPELIAQAQQYADSVQQVAISYQTAANSALALKSAGIDAFQQGLADLLANADKIENLGDAFKNLARTVTQTLAKIAAEILARQATLALLKAFNISGGPGGGAGGAAAGSALAGLFGWHGGLVKGYDAGGTIGGPVLPVPGPDKVPIMAAKGEFMLRRARVSEPGALAFLHAWNSGRFSLADVMSRPRFAKGGLIGGVGATPAADPGEGNGGGGGRFRIVNVVDEKLVQDALASSAGERVFLNVIQRNASKVRGLLGG